MKQQRVRRVQRNIQCDPQYTCFKPAWVSRGQIEVVELLIGEYEAIRLRDIKHLSMQQWAKYMWVSAPTFNRMVNSAHRKITDAIVHGKWIRIYTQEEDIGDIHNQF